MLSHKLNPNSLKLVKFLPFISTGFHFTLVRFHMKRYQKLNVLFLWNGWKIWHLFFCEFIALYNKVSLIGITLTISNWTSYLLAHNFGRTITEFIVSFASASKNARNIKTTEELLVMVLSFHLIKVLWNRFRALFLCLLFSSGVHNDEVYSLRGSIIDMHYLQ